jgi:hypothetical protein
MPPGQKISFGAEFQIQPTIEHYRLEYEDYEYGLSRVENGAEYSDNLAEELQCFGSGKNQHVLADLLFRRNFSRLHEQHAVHIGEDIVV